MNYTQNRKIMQGLLPRQPYGVSPRQQTVQHGPLLKLLTKRNRGRNVRRVMQKVKVFIRGWIGYFRVADMKRTLMSWNEWMRRRF